MWTLLPNITPPIILIHKLVQSSFKTTPIASPLTIRVLNQSHSLTNYPIEKPAPSYFSNTPKYLHLKPIISCPILIINPKNLVNGTFAVTISCNPQKCKQKSLKKHEIDQKKISFEIIEKKRIYATLSHPLTIEGTITSTTHAIITGHCRS